MSYTRFRECGLAARGLAVMDGPEETPRVIVNETGRLSQEGEEITVPAAVLNALSPAVTGAALRFMSIDMGPDSFSDDSEVKTGITLPAKAIVKNVFVDVVTKEDTASTKTIDVGTDSGDGGDADGYLSGVSVAAEGIVKGTLADGAVTLGELLYTETATSDNPVPEPDVTMGGKEITVTAGDAGGFTEAVFNVVIEYIEIA